MTLVKNQASGANWTSVNADSCEFIRSVPTDSIHLQLMSIPFSSLYVYSPHERDIGNCRDDDEFSEHMGFLAREMYRVAKLGRVVSIHCMDLPSFKSKDGEIGMKDFRGLVIKIFRDAGFIWNSSVLIRKDPVTAMQRTKSIRLLHKQVKKDACMSGSVLAEYMLQFYKPLATEPGDKSLEMLEWVLREILPSHLLSFKKDSGGPDPVIHTDESYPVELWQRVAESVWTDINPSDTLQYRAAREDEDERHICPLQLEPIKRIIELYSNPGDTVADWFGGIASTPVTAIRMGRRGLACELKTSYWAQGVRNLRYAEDELKVKQLTLGGL